MQTLHLTEVGSPAAHVRFGSKADMCSALGDVCFVPIADNRKITCAQKEKKDRLATASAKSDQCFEQAPVFFRFLRPASNPTRPRPVAKSGRAAGRGVATTSLKPVTSPILELPPPAEKRRLNIVPAFTSASRKSGLGCCAKSNETTVISRVPWEGAERNRER